MSKKMIAGLGDHKSLYPVPHGTLNPDLVAYAHANSLPFNHDTLKGQVPDNSGHPNMRAVMDSLSCSSTNEMVAYIRKNRETARRLKKGMNMRIFEPGSKYA